MLNAHSSSQPTWKTLAELILPNQPGTDGLAQDLVTATVRSLHLSPADLERVEMAVAKAILNAIESGIGYRSDLPVSVLVRVSAKAVAEKITYQGDAPVPDPETPNLTAKVLTQESSHGWGLFLIERMVSEFQPIYEGTHHTIELFLYPE